MSYEDKINAVDRMQVYIKEHLREVITLNMLADIAGYSPWYAARIFKELVGISAFEYIRKLRLSSAALMLRDDEVKVIDVAFDYLFDSHEGFTRAFSKSFGMTPKKYAQQTPPIQLFMPYYIRHLYVMRKKGERPMSEKNTQNTVFVQVVEKAARKLILKRGIKATHYFEYCEEVGCDVWGILSSIKGALGEPLGLWLPKKLIRENTSEYVQGVEVPLDFEGAIPEGFEVIDLNPCKMMIFQGQPFKDEDFSEAIADLWKVIDNYDPTLYGFEFAADEAPRFQMEPQGYRGYIEGRPVKKL